MDVWIDYSDCWMYRWICRYVCMNRFYWWMDAYIDEWVDYMDECMNRSTYGWMEALLLRWKCHLAV